MSRKPSVQLGGESRLEAVASLINTAARAADATPSALVVTQQLLRSCTAEFIGTAFLLISVVGSGILGERLAAGNTAVALLANALATAAALYALIEWLTPLSGAHLNPIITLVMTWRGDNSPGQALFYSLAQISGAIAGVVLANLMFDTSAVSLSAHVRTGPAQWLSEFISTFGLVGAAWTCSQLRPSSTAGVIAAYIGGAFFFTATDFANPAVTIARAFTDSFSGIRAVDVPGFLMSEAAGAIAAAALFRWLVQQKQAAKASGSTS